MSNEQTEDRFHMIDAETLSNVLAEEAWKVDTKNISTSDLYETHVVAQLNGEVEVKKEVRSKWSSLFWNLRENYRSLIMSHKQKDNESGQEVTNSRGDTV